MEYFIIRGIK